MKAWAGLQGAGGEAVAGVSLCWPPWKEGAWGWAQLRQSAMGQSGPSLATDLSNKRTLGKWPHDHCAHVAILDHSL